MEVAEKNMFFNCNNLNPTYNENGKSSSKRISTTTKKKKPSDFNQNVNNTNLATNATMQHPTTTIASDYKQFKLIFYMCLLLIYRFLLLWSICQDNILKLLVSTSSKRNSQCIKFLLFLTLTTTKTLAYPNNNQNQNDLIKFDKLNLEQSIAAVFNKVAYGSTTKRSIPDTAYPLTTLATPLLTTFRYSDGQDEWLRVDLKNNGAPPLDLDESGGVGGGEQDEYDEEQQRGKPNGNYGFDLEKDHVLPTSAPAADILKNNNNKHYTNPNRYNNDRLRPDYNAPVEQVTENVYKTTTSSNNAKNVRPTKSIYSKDIPSYVPPSRAFFFTPPLPPQYQNPFADKPTLRGTNSDGFASRRPLPPPSLMPNKDRIPFRPDLPSTKVNMEKIPAMYDETTVNNRGRSQQQGGITPAAAAVVPSSDNKKKSLNTPSQNAKFGNGGNGGEFYGLNRNHLMNETNQFEYEKSYAPEPSITRILSGSNGRHDDIQIPDILYRTVTATPNFPAVGGADGKRARTPVVAFPQPSVPKNEEEEMDSDDLDVEDEQERKLDGDKIEKQEPMHAPPLESSIIVVANKSSENQMKNRDTADVTTQISDMMNLPNVKKRENANNVTKANSDEIWLICWNVHIYLVVFGYILLAIYSIFKLIRYEYDPHMFSKSYFLTIHLMLTVICVLRIFYLIYDPYNFGNSFNIFLYEFLHSFPLSLLATTFAVLILFLLKRTLTHLEVNRPVFLVFFGLLHILICLTLSTMESFGHFDKASLTICRPSFVLLVLALGISYLYLYRIIKNVLAKRSQNLSEMCTQNISYASHITIAIALLFVLLGLVQLYALFFIKIDRFNGEIKHHWILWGFELSIRFIELTIITLLAIVVSLKMAQREKQCGGGGGTTGGGGNGFPLFPTCTTSDSSTDNIYPNNCNSNPNVMNYSRNNEMLMDNLQSNGGQQAMETDTGTAPRIMLKANSNLNDFDKKSTLERCYPSGGGVQTENWLDGASTLNLNNSHFERSSQRNSKQQLNNIGAGNSTTYDSAKYYTKPKYDFDDLVSNTSSSTSTTGAGGGKMRIVGNVGEENEKNIYSEPIDNHYNQQQQHHQHQYERTRHEFERNDLDRRSRNSTNTSGRRTGTSGGAGGRRKNHGRPHLGIQTLPPNEKQQQQHQIDSMLVDEQGFLRFRHMQDENNKRAMAGDDAMLMMMMGESGREKSVKKNKRQYQQQQQNYNVESCGGGGHFSDA